MVMTLALVLTWSAPDSVLLKQSYGTLYYKNLEHNAQASASGIEV